MNSPSNDAARNLAAPRATACTDWSMPLLLAGASAFLYGNLFLLPWTPILQGGDQVFFWMDAQRMLFGERVYRDFFQFTPPGTDLFSLALFKVLGSRIWVTNATVLILGAALVGVCFWVASGVMERRPALLAALLFLTLVYSKLLNATHHWFSVLMIMVAAAVAIRGRTWARTAAVGALLGTASFFTQTHAVVAVGTFALWLLWQELPRRKRWVDPLKHPALPLVSFGIVVLALHSYFLATIGARQLWYYEVTFIDTSSGPLG
jgi:hypothetical protein